MNDLAGIDVLPPDVEGAEVSLGVSSIVKSMLHLLAREESTLNVKTYHISHALSPADRTACVRQSVKHIS